MRTNQEFIQLMKHLSVLESNMTSKTEALMDQSVRLHDTQENQITVLVRLWWDL